MNLGFFPRWTCAASTADPTATMDQLFDVVICKRRCRQRRWQLLCASARSAEMSSTPAFGDALASIHKSHGERPQTAAPR